MSHSFVFFLIIYIFISLIIPRVHKIFFHFNVFYIENRHHPPSSSPLLDQSSILMHSFVNDHANDAFTRSILIENAARQRGFLPYDYRLANTFESIRQQRLNLKPLTKLPVLPPPPPPVKSHSLSPRYDVFGNLITSMTKLAEQRLILRDKGHRKKYNSTSIIDKQEKEIYTMTDADFATDIPNALEFVLKNTKRKSTMEQNILETFKRERLEQARYRRLPINRAPYTHNT